VYFSIDDQNINYNRSKGQGPVKIIEDPKKTVTYGSEIYMKYLGTLDHPVPKTILDSTKKLTGTAVTLSFDFSKRQFPYDELPTTTKSNQKLKIPTTTIK
jgi:hypothetical protein